MTLLKSLCTGLASTFFSLGFLLLWGVVLLPSLGVFFGIDVVVRANKPLDAISEATGILLWFLPLCMLLSSWTMSEQKWALNGRWACPGILLLPIIFLLFDARAASIKLEGLSSNLLLSLLLSGLTLFAAFLGGGIGDRRRKGREGKAAGTTAESRED